MINEDPGQLQDSTQEILIRLEEWGHTHDIHFSPQKSEAVYYNWTEDYTLLSPLTIYNSPLTVSPHFKYLGLIITDDLPGNLTSTLRLKKHGRLWP
jgi:hypothetical protein